MKRIGIDARLYFQTGVGVYLRNFLHYLQQESPEQYIFYVYVLKKDSSKITFSNPRFIKKEVTSRWHSVSEQLVFFRALMQDNLDLMHFTYFSFPILYYRPFIATIHDVTPLLFKTGKASTLPSFIYNFKHNVLSFVLSQQVRNAKVIITPTNAVKKQLMSIYGDRYANKISALYEGVNQEFFEVKENAALSDIFKRDFFLYVGNFYPHKNVNRLIEAFEDLDRKDIDLVLAGPGNYFSGSLEKLLHEKKISNIRMYHPSKVGDLLFLYNHALALVNPSLSEGFGLPIVEAAYCGTPVIASDIDVFKEILGDNYISFNPLDTKDIMNKLNEFLNSTSQKKTILDKKYSFKNMVKEYIVLISKIV
ncbi:glycosyltransferase family 1 protein [soil metagenome]